MTDAKQADLAPAEIIDVPRFFVSGFNVTLSATDVLIVASSTIPAVSNSEIIAAQRPEAILTMSPQAAKEFMVLLEGLIAQYEKELGPITTPFLREREKS